MITKRQSVIIPHTEEGAMEISVQGDQVVFENNETDATYVFFTIDKEDWVELKNFIDKQFGITSTKD